MFHWSRSPVLLLALLPLLFPATTQAEIYATYDYPSCYPMGTDYDESTGQLWIADLGNGCPPYGKIYTFDPSTEEFQLEFVVSDAVPGAGANDIEIVGDHVYVADATLVNVYKFTRDGVLVQIYDMSTQFSIVVGLGYRNGVFYVTAPGQSAPRAVDARTMHSDLLVGLDDHDGDVIAPGQSAARAINAWVYGFTENVGTGEMEPTGHPYPLPLATSYGFLDYDPNCDVWLRTSAAADAAIWVLDPEDFSVIDMFPSEIFELWGASVGPPNGNDAAMYAMESLGNTRLIYRSNESCVLPQPYPHGQIIDTWDYPAEGCDPLGMDVDPSTGKLWIADQGYVGACEPKGQIFTFDPSTEAFQLEFVVSDLIGDPDAWANGIEIVGDHVYITHYNEDNPGGPLDDSIYKFTRDGLLVEIYEMSSFLDGLSGIGYLDGVFYAVSGTAGRVFSFNENVGTGQMELLGSYALPYNTAGGFLDYDPIRGVWLRTALPAPYAVWLLDPADFSTIDLFYSEVERSTGVAGVPTAPGEWATYLIETIDPNNIRLIYRSWPTTGVEVEPSAPRRQHLRVFPNPLQTDSTLEWHGGARTVRLYSPLGRLVLTRDVGSSPIGWDALIGDRDLSPGVYFIQIGQETRRVVLLR
ncbi:MAG: T9SS type A sorting domain-containing protein [Candidatus Eiseniibacteriota bacterium]|jgi:hypothetical protein